MTEILSYNPSNETLLGKIDETSTIEIEDIVLRSQDAFSLWKKTPLQTRIEILR